MMSHYAWFIVFAVVLSLATETVKYYNAQNDMIVLDKNDLIQLAQELKE